MEANNVLGKGIEDEATPELPGNHIGFAEMAVDAMVGAAAGATTGILAGPPGIIAGAVLGGAIGAAAATVLHEDQVEKERVDEQRDRDIGVIGGNIGEARPDAPKSERGVFHAASMGLGSGGAVTPAEGPMQSLDED
jgi:hypothetical protein